MPLEAARMAACVRELDKLSESIPLDITEASRGLSVSM